MADTPKTNPPAEDDMHWGIAYLREDIQDLRLDQRAGLERMERIAARIEAVNDNLSARMDSRFAVLLTAMITLIGVSIGANFAFLQMYRPHQ